jgi:hypothetical protein
MTDEEKLKNLYADLKRAYDLTLDRRKTLGGQATGIISFAGIIQTILIALMVALATNKDVRALLTAVPEYSTIILFGSIGFIAYIATAIFAILAFREPYWFRAPEMYHKATPILSIIDYFDHPDNYDLKSFAIQLEAMTESNQETNKKKYFWLKCSLISLIVGIGATTVVGFILIKLAGELH